jgi:pimeloyl-ACP methyl ester carboxylesterase
MMAILASGSRRKALANVKVPTVVIHGDADPLVPLESGVDTAESISGARMMSIEGMGHALPVRTWASNIDAVSGHAQQAGG